MKVSIIIVTTDHLSEVLKTCLDSIEEYTDLSDKEIVVVANGCTDKTVEYVASKKFKGLPYRVLELPQKVSFPKANNLGASFAEGEYLLFLHDDTKVMDKTKKNLWVDWLLGPYQNDPTVGITGLFKARDTYTKESFILFVCCMVKKDVFISMGELDESITTDNSIGINFAIKLRKNGYKVKQVPDEFPIDDITNLAGSYSPVGHRGISNKLYFSDESVIKIYLPDNQVNKLSSMENELYCTKKFSMGGRNPYCPEVEKRDEDSIIMKRYKFSLGTSIGIKRENVRRMFFTISFQEFDRQLWEIEKLLKKTEINHRDVNPANVLFSEKERRLKLIDFYWAKTDKIIIGNPQVLWTYDDSEAFRRIREMVLEVFESMRKPIENMFSTLSEMGKVHRDGSAPAPGMAYHKIDIPYFHVVSAYKDISKEFNDIFKNITCSPKKAIDIGCSLGYNSFNLMRKFFLDKLFAYEADPYVVSFLQDCKKIFALDEFEVVGKIEETTEFPQVDVVLCTNVHQWIYRQLGKDKTGILMRKLVNNCKEMFFQSSGLESGGEQVKEFRNKENIQNYLYSVGARDVSFISSSQAHGGVRHLFKVRGNYGT